MRYIKKYERLFSSNQKIKIGDYVAKTATIYPNLPNGSVGIVTNKKNKAIYTEYLVIFDFPFDLNARFFDDDIRLATQKEIERYKLEKDANKYNI